MCPDGRPRVVLADDHSGVIAAAGQILAPSCEVVALVADGVSAIDATLKLNPDVAILDVAMPGLDGFQVCTRIRASGSKARVIFLSNHAGDDFVLESLERGASGFVAKSRMARDLVHAVSHVHAGRAFVPAASLLPRWHRPAGRRHDLQLHATDAVLLEGVLAFLESALDAGNSIGLIVSSSRRQFIDGQLSARGYDVGALAAANRYVFMDVDQVVDVILRDGRLDYQRLTDGFDLLIDQALVADGPPRRVCLFGEIAKTLHARGFCDAMLEVEYAASVCAASRPVSILCGCPLDICDDHGEDLMARICEAHATIVPAGPPVR